MMMLPFTDPFRACQRHQSWESRVCEGSVERSTVA